MRRGMLLCVLVAAPTMSLGAPGTALAGGGCHAGATQADGTDQKEVMVRIADACFTPSLTTVDPGAAVTFVNEDWTTHNVGGNEWGHFEDMREGDAFTATFIESGIYPFACSYHPGMTGAIVVGDGMGTGSGESISIQPFEATSPKVIRSVVAEDGGLPIGALVAVGLGGLALGVGVMLGISRFGRTSPAA
jgi:plastocyanin